MCFGGYKMSGNKLQVLSTMLQNFPSDQTHLVAWIISTLTFTSRPFTSCFCCLFASLNPLKMVNGGMTKVKAMF